MTKRTFNDSAVAFGYRKKPRVTLEDIIERLDKINSRLDNIVSKNNLLE